MLILTPSEIQMYKALKIPHPPLIQQEIQRYWFRSVHPGWIGISIYNAFEAHSPFSIRIPS